MRHLVFSTLLILSFLPCIAVAQSVEELNKSAVEKIRSGDLEGADADFSKALAKSDKSSALVYHNIGVSYEKEGHIKKAVAYYEEAIKRNPKQIESYEKAGLLNFKLKRYNRAVKIGQKGMDIDPQNEQIPKWLNTAYNKKVREEKKQSFSGKKKFKQKAKRTLSAGLEVAGIGGVYNTPFSFGYVPNEGFLPLSSNIYIDYLYKKKWGFRLNTGNPHNGAVMNDKLLWQERFECYYNYGNYYVGGGLLGTHYNGKHFGKESTMFTDFKLGFIYAYQGKENVVDLVWYPRLLPSDTGLGKDYTVDTSVFQITYIRAYSHLFDLYGAVEMNEYYYFNNKSGTSNFEGHYDFSAGVFFFNHTGSKFKILTYLTERLYLEDYNNERPYESFNGQGFFGINTDLWFFGEPFSGVKSIGSQINGKFIEVISPNLIVYQKLSFEYVQGTQEKHEITIQLGIEGGF